MSAVSKSQASPNSQASPALAQRVRDPRLDFFRGIGMFIILIAHVPWNGWTEWIPARFGFSDAADMFVFCSGAASALAFAPIFDVRGWWMGTLRIIYRVWQVYWAHITVFFVTLAFVVWADQYLGVDHYVREELNIGTFFEHPQQRILGLMTLTYVPNYFDILPMYLVILGMIPIVMALAKVSRWVVLGFVLVSWAGANLAGVHFVADSIEDRNWFFNPFGWQILFFTSFAFVRGWLPVPQPDVRLIVLCIILIVVSAPVSCQIEFSCYAGFGAFPILGDIHQELDPFINKVDMGVLRYVHFLATAYLAYIACGAHGARLTGRLVDIICRVGQQTLAVFLTGVVAAQVLGFVLDILGRTFWTEALVNIGGCLILIVAAFLASFFKSSPWRRPKVPVAQASRDKHAAHESADRALIGSKTPEFAPSHPGQRS